jgi:hypothetical protein
MSLARWRLLRRKRRLERHLDGPYDRAISLELDRIIIALEALA